MSTAHLQKVYKPLYQAMKLPYLPDVVRDDHIPCMSFLMFFFQYMSKMKLDKQVEINFVRNKDTSNLYYGLNYDFSINIDGSPFILLNYKTSNARYGIPQEQLTYPFLHQPDTNVFLTELLTKLSKHYSFRKRKDNIITASSRYGLNLTEEFLALANFIRDLYNYNKPFFDLDQEKNLYVIKYYEYNKVKRFDGIKKLSDVKTEKGAKKFLAQCILREHEVLNPEWFYARGLNHDQLKIANLIKTESL